MWGLVLSAVTIAFSLLTETKDGKVSPGTSRSALSSRWNSNAFLSGARKFLRHNGDGALLYFSFKRHGRDLECKGVFPELVGLMD